jgi:tRNA1Val (adenine37-N6)-methyltransferase
VSVHTEDAQQWIPRQTVRFDLIISNPPYYEQGVECATPQREQARYTTSLDHQRCLRWRRTALRKTVFLCGATGADW